MLKILALMSLASLSPTTVNYCDTYILKKYPLKKLEVIESACHEKEGRPTRKEMVTIEVFPGKPPLRIGLSAITKIGKITYTEKEEGGAYFKTNHPDLMHETYLISVQEYEKIKSLILKHYRVLIAAPQ